MREAHILSSKGREYYPEYRIYFDTESHVQTKITDEDIYKLENGIAVHKEHRLYMIGARFRMGDRLEKECYRIDKDDAFDVRFWNDVDRKLRWRKTAFMYAHNGKYDVQASKAIPNLIRLGYTVTEFSDDNPFFMIFEKYDFYDRYGRLRGEIKESFTPSPNMIYSHELMIPKEQPDGSWFVPKPRIKKIQIISSTNIYATSLAKLGKTYGIEKLDFDHDEEFTYDAAETYCMVDVEILDKAMESWFQFLQDESLGGFSLTVAGQSFKAYRRRFMNVDIYIHDDERALQIERAAYAGGRTEVFRMGSYNKIYYVDVNSMYPYVMKKHKYPKRLVTRWKTTTIENMLQFMNDNDYLICADCLIKTDKPIYMKKGKRLLFPTGQFWTSLSTPEILYAIEHGHLLEVENVCFYESDYLFVEFVDYFYNARLDAKHAGDEVRNLLYKLIMNSLYGKFGQRMFKNIVVDTAPIDEVGEYTIYDEVLGIKYRKVFGGKVWEKDESAEAQEAYNSFPAIAAHVTSYARMLLWDGIDTVGLENMYYCDTDSLMCSEAGYQKLLDRGLIDPDRLGAFKLEDIGDVELYGGKDYVFTGRDGEKTTKLKGVGKNGTRELESKNGKKRFVTTQWGGLNKQLKRGYIGNYYNTLVIKEIKRIYTKGEVQANGEVKPFELDEQPRTSNVINAFEQDTLINTPDNIMRTRRAKRVLYLSPNGLSIKEFIKKHHLSIEEVETFLQA